MACGENKSLGLVRRKRQLLILFLFFTWIIILTFRLGDIMIFSREEILKNLSITTPKILEKPATRGTIFSTTGEKMAWSETFFKLVWQVPINEKEVSKQLKLLPPIIKTLPAELTKGELIVLCSDLKKGQLSQALELVGTTKSFTVKSYSRRFNNGEITRIGIVKNNMGLSGLEKKYNTILAGKKGIYSYIMKNKSVNHHSWNEIQTLENGQDIIIDKNNFRKIK